MYTLVISSLAVAIVAFIVYALERKAKSEPIIWENALKLSLFGGLVTSGVVFATTVDIPEVVTTVTETLPSAAQEMFVGTPSF